MTTKWWADYGEGLRKALDGVPPERFEQLCGLMEDAYRHGRQIFMMGNGGSGSTASHMTCDLNKGVSYGLEKRLKVICLNDNLATLMAYANDVSYEEVFVEQLKNFLQPGDLVIAFSGSGNSRNVLKAIDYANQSGAHTVGLCGFDGGKLSTLAQTSILAPVHDMQQVEDVHLIIFHALMQILCRRLRELQTPVDSTRT
jgi:D-sedoheptulose 7-phosphate isomerase